MGWIAALPLTVTQPTFRVVHLARHAKTNQPDDDPDFLVGRGPWWSRPASFLAPLWDYRIHYYRRHGSKNRGELAARLGFDAGLVALVTGTAVTGSFATLAVLWLLPALVPRGPTRHPSSTSCSSGRTTTWCTTPGTVPWFPTRPSSRASRATSRRSEPASGGAPGVSRSPA